MKNSCEAFFEQNQRGCDIFKRTGESPATRQPREAAFRVNH